jgi:hypothetical protein
MITTIERIKLAIERGVTYEPISGNIYGIKGGLITALNDKGYQVINLRYNGKKITIKGHQFAYYFIHKNCPKCIDHKDNNKSNNKIDNLREVTNQQNTWNSKSKGYSYDKSNNKYRSEIMLNGKRTNLGNFNTENEARQAYLDAKKIYHKI